MAKTHGQKSRRVSHIEILNLGPIFSNFFQEIFNFLDWVGGGGGGVLGLEMDYLRFPTIGLTSYKDQRKGIEKKYLTIDMMKKYV